MYKAFSQYPEAMRYFNDAFKDYQMKPDIFANFLFERADCASSIILFAVVFYLFLFLKTCFLLITVIIIVLFIFILIVV
jgi:hypothetical protein